jgi:hypothetical protein
MRQPRINAFKPAHQYTPNQALHNRMHWTGKNQDLNNRCIGTGKNKGPHNRCIGTGKKCQGMTSVVPKAA